MTISSSTRKAGPFTGNGTTATYPFVFKIFQASDLVVVRTSLTGVETTLALTTDYTVSLNADQNSSPGGSVTLVAGNLATGLLLTMTSQVPYTQTTDLTNQGGFYPQVITNALDKLTIEVQQLNEQVGRSAKLPISSTTDADALVADIVALANDQANIDIVATNIGSVNTAATNIAAIVAAPTQASNAAASASAASGSASAAAASESSAAASAAAAAASLDNFDDRYLGAKSSDPTVDNDGNPLVVGALYYRTTAPIGMKVYDGAQWLEASAAQQAALVTYEYVATAGQTTFSGPDANALTLAYIAGGIIVSLNGAVLKPGDDYTATNGTSIVLASAAALNDELNAYAFASFNVANTYTQAQSDSRYAQLAAAQTFTAAQRGSITTLTDGATITADFATTNHFQVTLGGNRTLANPSNQTAGQSGAIRVVQDGTGSRTLAYGSNWKFPAGAAPVLTTTANAVDILVYFVESASRITARLISDVK